MIDLENAKQAFKEYLKQYDMNNGSINLKVRHTYGVVESSEYIAKGLNLDEENIELAKLIALLHDIGRFEQMKKTSTFFDNSNFDHAIYGVKVLFDENLIRKFIKDNKYDDIIYKSILNHNKYKVNYEGLNELELLHVKIIRDADKLDNFRVKEEENLEDLITINEDLSRIGYIDISEKIYNDFMNHNLILNTDRKTQMDIWVSYIAFIFDFNFDISLKFIGEKNHVNKLIDRIEYKNENTKQKMEEIRKCGNDYIIEKTKNT